MIACRGAPTITATPLATRLSAALRRMFVLFIFIYYTVEIQSTHKYNGWHICLLFTQTMASVAWRLKSNWGSRPQSLRAFGNCPAIILRPLASVCLASLVENLDTTRRWNGMSNDNSSLLRRGMLQNITQGLGLILWYDAPVVRGLDIHSEFWWQDLKETDHLEDHALMEAKY
jgi:hypothetical protein